MNSGFLINRLICTGDNVEDVSINFNPNTHVIVGPSNTGKSYVFQCIKYMLGSETKPKRITESIGYQDCFLEVTLANGDIITLRRSLDGGDAELYKCEHSEIRNYPEPPTILRVGKKPTQKIGTLNNYLLDVSNLRNVKVRRNLSGVSDEFKFSFIRHLTLIDETSIIKESSPIFTGQYGEDTKEKSILRYLSTGKDDSGIISKPKKDVISNRKGRMEVIDQLIEEYSSELNDYDYILQENEKIDEQIDKLERSIVELKDLIDSLYVRVTKYESTINRSWKEWKSNESRLLTVNELLSRSNLLHQHYLNDIDRLESVQETSNLFSELQFGNCPTCKQSLEGDEHLECDINDLENIKLASRKEIEKIKKLIFDLDITRKSLIFEKEELSQKIKSNKEDHIKYQEELSDFISRNIKTNVEKLDLLKNKLTERKQINRIIEKISNLENQKSDYKEEIDPMEGNYTFDELTTATTTELCKVIKQLLIEWGYSDIKSVSFSEETCDLVINGEHRNLAGKGYRALSYSAFIIGLMHHCIENRRSHSGVVLLDSPLCTLRSRHITKSSTYEQKDVIGDATKEKFYASISKYRDLGQIIILDNDGPIEPDSLHIGYTEFTEDKNRGRYGFYPVQ
ncbi:AAA family ATPase [Vibrio parahaemolyticus]|nr:AAA family ATPase [Vibrio parahaemolyticus]